MGSSYGACTTLIDKCYVLNNIQVDGGGSTGGILGTVSAPDASIEQMNATISTALLLIKQSLCVTQLPAVSLPGPNKIK